MLIGFFEGIESERGIAWRVADSLCLREFLQIGLDERTPDHVTISRTRRLLDEATHPRPNFELIKKRSAEWLGGSPGGTHGFDPGFVGASARDRLVADFKGGSLTSRNGPALCCR